MVLPGRLVFLSFGLGDVEFKTVIVRPSSVVGDPVCQETGTAGGAPVTSWCVTKR